MPNILIKNGTIVNANKTLVADVLIDNGKIVNVAKNLSVSNHHITVIDAFGKYLLPGGIDPHVHLNLSTPYGFSADDFYSGSRAALAGGTTTIIDFVTPESRSESLLSALEKRKEEAENCCCNYAFHMSPLAWNNSVAKEIEQCITNKGIPSFKIYMAYKSTIGIDLSDIKNLMTHISGLNGVLLVHAEDGEEIERLRNVYNEQGKTENKYHALSRPPEVEEKAISELIKLVKQTNCRTYIVHTSSGKSLELIQQAQQNGLPIYAETCPQYLMFDESKLDQPFYQSAPYIFSPALHSLEHKELLWEGLTKQKILTIGTDHCPFNLYGQKDLGLNDYSKVPNGAGGIQYRLELLYTFGVLTGKISIQQFVNLVSTQAANIFGLSTKGIIDIGYDADIVIWNPKAEKTITSKNQWQNCDHNIYEGIAVRGEAEQVILQGDLAYDIVLGFSNKKGTFLYRNAIKNSFF